MFKTGDIVYCINVFCQLIDDGTFVQSQLEPDISYITGTTIFEFICLKGIDGFYNIDDFISKENYIIKNRVLKLEKLKGNLIIK